MSLTGKRPQMTGQLVLPFMHKGEAQHAQRSEEESMAANEIDTPGMGGLMERVVSRDNLRAALNRVRKNKGSPGVDGMTVDELGPYLRDNWLALKSRLLDGTYQPQAVRQKLIPKAGGKTRMLGIPTVVDRFIQQALLQVLQPMYDPTFSDHSHGFRPGRSAHDALREACDYVAAGKKWVVDVDLAKFFDRVNHDILMSRVARRVADRRILGLIRRYLTAGMLVDGVVMRRDMGTPQGGPLSPLLANILLDEIDKEMERRGHAFVRYADDSRVFVQSKRAGERVLRALRRLYGRLQLEINEAKSAVAPFDERAFLGYELYSDGEEVGPTTISEERQTLPELGEERDKAVKRKESLRRGHAARAQNPRMEELLWPDHGYASLADPRWLDTATLTRAHPETVATQPHDRPKAALPRRLRPNHRIGDKIHRTMVEGGCRPHTPCSDQRFLR